MLIGCLIPNSNKLWLLGFQRGERKKQNKKKEKGRNRTTGRTEEAEISNRGEELLYFTDSSVETKKGCSWYIGSVSSFESTCVLNWTNLGVECLLCNKKFLVKVSVLMPLIRFCVWR